MIILVTGSRHANHDTHGTTIRKTLIWVTYAWASNDAGHEVWDGEALGADNIAHSSAIELGWNFRRFPADWDNCALDGKTPDGMRPCTPTHRRTRSSGQTYCPTAGHRRNQTMVDELLLADQRKVCVAFPIPKAGSHGTADCLTRAWRAGIPTLVIPLR